ncbi:Gfo/Idh/MocA family oxidoreductase [bacterium]|nr:Gfo/Idh/MocA family oxidoreductase [bacterium]
MKPNSKTRIGVIGCGFFAQNHLNAWKSLGPAGVELAAVCDIDPDKAKSAASQFDVPAWFANADEMLTSADIDMVDIVTQVRSHKVLAEKAINAGIATIVQKPFAFDQNECSELVELAEAKNVFLAVHENFRFQKPNIIVHDLIKSGAIGNPNWARISFRTGYDIYAGQPYLLDAERFIITDVGAHVLDLARVFLGEVKHLSAELQSRNPNAKGEDTATMVLRHTSGAVSVVECTYESRRRPDPFPETMIELEGTTGSIRVKSNLQIELTSRDELSFLEGDVPVLPWAERPWHVVQESVLRTCEHIRNSFVAGTPADVSGTDNLKTFALCEAAYKAANIKSSVSPDY